MQIAPSKMPWRRWIFGKWVAQGSTLASDPTAGKGKKHSSSRKPVVWRREHWTHFIFGLPVYTATFFVFHVLAQNNRQHLVLRRENATDSAQPEPSVLAHFHTWFSGLDHSSTYIQEAPFCFTPNWADWKLWWAQWENSVSHEAQYLVVEKTKVKSQIRHHYGFQWRVTKSDTFHFRSIIS